MAQNDAVSQYQGLTRSRLRMAKFGPRYLGLTMDTPLIKTIMENNPKVATGIKFWMQQVRDGKIVEAIGQFSTCGKGMWIVGEDSDPVACAAIQTLIIEGSLKSAHYLLAEQYLDSERPGGEDEAFRDFLYSEGGILILSGYGLHRQSDWADKTLDNLIANRFHKGLPTIVTAERLPPESISGVRRKDVFVPPLRMEGWIDGSSSVGVENDSDLLVP